MAIEEYNLREARHVVEQEQGLEFYLSIIRRRWAYFLLPFVIALSMGTLVALLLPPLYRSEARILVQSQQIPLDLVQPTVTASAEERIQVIAQRIMTRDHLKAIVDKFQMFPKWRGSVSDTDLVDLMRERTSITPIALTLNSFNRNAVSSAMAFTVGFEYENPEIVARVANEFVTLILNEDARARKVRASETTKFLAQEVERLEQEQFAIEAQIGQFKGRSTSVVAAQLAVLKTALLEKSVIYSESHPEIKALKDRITALEHSSGEVKGDGTQEAGAEPSLAASAAPTKQGDGTEYAGAKSSLAASAAPTNDATPGSTTLSVLLSKQESNQDDLDKARQKLLIASRGERLEEDQQAERFEVIEQPSLPEEPVKPNRKKILAMSLALSIVAGLAGVFAIEAYDKTIRGTVDLPIPPRLVVPIPYISTLEEMNRSRNRLKSLAGAAVVALMVVLALTHWFVMPLDLLFEKIAHRLTGL